MEQNSSLVEEKETVQTACKHHWIIGYPEGPISRGICRICGEQREFRNSIDTSLREDNMWTHSLSGGGTSLDSLINEVD